MRNQDLELVFKNCINELSEEFKEINLLDKQVYLSWLAQTYFFTSHSEKTLKYISSKSQNNDESQRWSDHATEEQGHENLALGDLKRLNGNISDYQEFEETAMLYRAQYYYCAINKSHACFGWILALEGLAALIDKNHIAKIIETHGKRACKFIEVHTNEDPEHLDSAFEAISKIADKEMIIENLISSTYFYKRMLQRVKEKAIEAKALEAA
ncbi:iron-containing redox enzyme family protein [Bacteriovorax sp. Seq25_V]|uniref:iron-containing redox enzyme family protein n=1 Tax=Bacteriovorax sp. Seq25_V TaxID=1201288 RepID=UPI00038A2298|nr:iron-containing redox enzyme family protein [Bacteriovorax sp. Seq25_V]EQC46084.1 hypothetical protein M900_1751 [Bacteriovorax sp. Seq25_V]